MGIHQLNLRSGCRASVCFVRVNLILWHNHRKVQTAVANDFIISLFSDFDARASTSPLNGDKHRHSKFRKEIPLIHVTRNVSPRFGTHFRREPNGSVENIKLVIAFER